MSCGVGKQRISTQRIRVRCLFTHQIARTAKTSTAVNVVFAMKFVLFSFFLLALAIVTRAESNASVDTYAHNYVLFHNRKHGTTQTRAQKEGRLCAP